MSDRLGGRREGKAAERGKSEKSSNGSMAHGLASFLESDVNAGATETNIAQGWRCTRAKDWPNAAADVGLSGRAFCLAPRGVLHASGVSGMQSCNPSWAAMPAGPARPTRFKSPRKWG
ncbi:hypothetical protein [Sphingomonas abietis]|uniref:Uncharacterized protein n=1 Tax=Sphingomonas abietis TaxID=3012344 RepID=A0ABY7NIR8_9SPHN|nr:hypothetical protein [Sphingomonas abietis]WBO20885.1 hypothetical protein PBT88_11745 [Sphingomonas abietis]